MLRRARAHAHSRSVQAAIDIKRSRAARRVFGCRSTVLFATRIPVCTCSTGQNSTYMYVYSMTAGELHASYSGG